MSCDIYKNFVGNILISMLKKFQVKKLLGLTVMNDRIWILMVFWSTNQNQFIGLNTEGNKIGTILSFDVVEPLIIYRWSTLLMAILLRVFRYQEMKKYVWKNERQMNLYAYCTALIVNLITVYHCEQIKKICMIKRA